MRFVLACSRKKCNRPTGEHGLPQNVFGSLGKDPPFAAPWPAAAGAPGLRHRLLLRAGGAWRVWAGDLATALSGRTAGFWETMFCGEAPALP